MEPPTKRLAATPPGNTGISLLGVFGVEAWASGSCWSFDDIEPLDGELSKPACRRANAVTVGGAWGDYGLWRRRTFILSPKILSYWLG